MVQNNQSNHASNPSICCREDPNLQHSRSGLHPQRILTVGMLESIPVRSESEPKIGDTICILGSIADDSCYGFVNRKRFTGGDESCDNREQVWESYREPDALGLADGKEYFPVGMEKSLLNNRVRIFMSVNRTSELQHDIWDNR
ncbi:hypothetical protein DM02DRAFT_632505 [Periconia macrospinosa]|uniref:Uncharacterized protein n=1 Tax=Periconia macrospinosa TaxID=97972 RepID=A0A2V1DCP9_9PLEO|nr:hypothetical protein DM02DRAFT_632505 [Periconia macrospinosa]